MHARGVSTPELVHGPPQALKGAVEAGADSAAGWKALAELQYQNRSWAEAYETSVKGLEWSVRRRAAGCETLTQFALSLRLCYARCLRRLGRLDESEYAFKVLAGAPACQRAFWVSVHRGVQTAPGTPGMARISQARAGACSVSGHIKTMEVVVGTVQPG